MGQRVKTIGGGFGLRHGHEWAAHQEVTECQNRQVIWIACNWAKGSTDQYRFDADQDGAKLLIDKSSWS
ncbi:hypothetical protein TKK_0013692 [Trichogramma kaykai]